MIEPDSSQLHVLTVFLGEDGGGGNPLGVFVDTAGWADATRQNIAADLGFSETVFVENQQTGALRIHTPEIELPLAGHPLVGTSWLLRRMGAPLATLQPPAGPVPTWVEGEVTWIRADPSQAPTFDTRQLADSAEVDAVTGGQPGTNLHVWAWQDEAAGQVRVRVFPEHLGVGEDEATGAAALRLTSLLGRPLTIRQGVGSQLDSRLGPDGTVDVGGRVAHLETRSYVVGDR